MSQLFQITKNIILFSPWISQTSINLRQQIDELVEEHGYSCPKQVKIYPRTCFLFAYFAYYTYLNPKYYQNEIWSNTTR